MVPKSDWGWQEYQGPSDPTAAPAGAPRVGCPGHVQAAFEYFQERHSTASGYLVPVPNHQNVSVKYTKNPIIRRCQQLLKKKKIITMLGHCLCTKFHSVFSPVVWQETKISITTDSGLSKLYHRQGRQRSCNLDLLLSTTNSYKICMNSTKHKY